MQAQLPAHGRGFVTNQRPSSLPFTVNRPALEFGTPREAAAAQTCETGQSGLLTARDTRGTCASGGEARPPRLSLVAAQASLFRGTMRRVYALALALALALPASASVPRAKTWPSTLAPEQGVEWPHELVFFSRGDAIWDYFNKGIAKTGTCHLKIGTPEQYPPPYDWKSSCGGLYPLGCQGDCQTQKGMYWKGEKHTCGSFPGWACELRCHYDPPRTSCP